MTKQQKEKLIELSNKGYNNWQLSNEMGIKLATIHSWKRKLRDAGVVLPAQQGRPRKGSIQSIKLITTVSEFEKQQSEDQI